MKPALIEINDRLLESGMDQVEIDHLMARFLEEEAFDFVSCVNEFNKEYNSSFNKHEVIH